MAGICHSHARQCIQQKLITDSRKARDLSEQAYRAGSITLTDVLDANRELLGGQDELDANRADAARAAVAVYRAFGGGWDAPAVQTAKR